MRFAQMKPTDLGSILTDFAVLLASFLVFALVTGLANGSQIVLDLLLYVIVVFACVRLSKRVVFEYQLLTSRALNLLLGNIVGLVLGSVIVMFLAQVLPGTREIALVVILSSIMAFFILGTISPMIKPSYRDMIRH